MDVRIASRPSVLLACMRETGPFMVSANTAWPRLASWLETVNVVDEGTEFMGVMHDDPDETPPEELRYDACVTVPAGFDAGDVLLQELPEGEYAVGLHVGPYERLGESWGALMEWLAASGREAAEQPCFEIYRNDPRTTPPESLETEICLPLKPRE